MEQVLLVRYGEIHLKGLNRPFFERKLIDGINNALRGFHARVRRDQGRIYVYGIAEDRIDDACDALTRVFGVHSISPAMAVEKDWDTIVAAAAQLTASSGGSIPRFSQGICTVTVGLSCASLCVPVISNATFPL